MIRSIVEQTGAQINVEDDGTVHAGDITAADSEDYTAEYEEGHVEPDLAESLAAAESMIEMRPDLFNGYVMKGKILISMGRRDDAVPFLKKAAELDPDGTRAQLQAVRAHDPAG